jgi:hypothetical protein
MCVDREIFREGFQPVSSSSKDLHDVFSGVVRAKEAHCLFGFNLMRNLFVEFKGTFEMYIKALKLHYSLYWKNRPSQQLFKVFICRYMFRPSLAIFRRNTQLFSVSYLTTTDPLFLCYRSYFVYGLANTAIVYNM